MGAKAGAKRVEVKQLDETVDDLKLHIDHRNCRLSLTTAAGPARLAIIDSNGNIVPVENVEKMMVNAAVDAMLDFLDPTLQSNVRHLERPS